MAKFATVLCILLVVSGSYGSFFDSLTSSLTNKISSATSKSKSKSSSLPGLSSLTDVASSMASAATSGGASSVISSITDAASSVASAATSGDATSALSSITNVASGLANAAGSTSGIGSLFSGITSAITSATNSASSNPLMSLFTGASTTWITTVSNQMKTQMNAVMGGFKSALQIIESGATVANDAMVSSIGQFGTILDSFTNTDLDVSSCTSMASEVESIAASAVMNTTTCTNEVMDTMQSDFDTTMTKMTAFLEDLYSFAKQVDTCSKDFWTSLSCMANVGSTTGTQAITDFSNVMNEMTVIMSDMAGVQSKMEGCGIKAAQKQVQSKILSYTIKIAECVAQLGAAGVTSGSSSTAVDAATKVLTSLTG